jgi:hypothetical protein
VSADGAFRVTEDSFRPTAESVLSFADEPVPVLRDRIALALRYTFSWDKALSEARTSLAYGTSDPLLTDLRPLEARVSAMQQALRGLLDMIPADGEFVGRDQKAAYEATSAAWTQLYTDLSLSLATLPQRPLLDQLGDLGAAFFRAPAAAAVTLAEQIAKMLRDLLGGAAAALWSNLWPWLLVAGGVGLVYVFRAPLARVVSKVSA